MLKPNDYWTMSFYNQTCALYKHFVSWPSEKLLQGEGCEEACILPCAHRL